jgi:putative transposase
MQEIYNAEDRAHAEKAIEAFAKTYGAKFPKAVAKIFSTVKLRTKVTRGAGSPTAALAMVFRLVESAQTRWRAITGAHLVPLVRAGARFENGVLVERLEAAAS